MTVYKKISETDLVTYKARGAMFNCIFEIDSDCKPKMVEFHNDENTCKKAMIIGNQKLQENGYPDYYVYTGDI